MSEQRALFDELGPRARRRSRAISGGVILLLAGLGALAALKLAENGQFSAQKWSPLFNPLDSQFTTVWTFLGGGLRNTALAGGIAIALSLVIGTVLALARVTSRRWYRWAIVGVMEFFRAVPVVISIFFASRFLPTIGVDLPLLWYLVVGLVLYNSIAIAEIVRAGILAVPRGQTEASAALGLSGAQNLWLVVLPQAFRLMLPSLISQLVIVVKDTALGFIIGFEELLRRGEIAVQTLGNPLQMYLLIGMLFFVVNSLVSALAQRVESGMRQRNGSRQSPPATLRTGFLRVPALRS
ncbi:amino acid ABC transporter permease [Leucobacter sp. M11]|uniref:amino acid ABC transporter permease n=1 Tax=Leucobacter sp. M11 TaxID=2993565 RepID=UPI002D7FECC4|nr:amino acid ABC transporter permease [Leucobacter sp. M11]MEB4614455.1 amino acid ABC transporter permease [Leucobacter sp. M11]